MRDWQGRSYRPLDEKHSVIEMSSAFDDNLRDDSSSRTAAEPPLVASTGHRKIHERKALLAEFSNIAWLIFFLVAILDLQEGVSVLLLVLLSFFLGRMSVFAASQGSSFDRSGDASTEDTFAPEGSLGLAIEMLSDYRGRNRSLVAMHHAVAADHGRCSDMGLEIMKSNGNAVDAAVTTALCQGVFNPMASGLGGGHISLIRLPNGTHYVIDARELAPNNATEDMFIGKPEASLKGGLAVGVPLELRGLHLAHSRFGLLPWSHLVEPVIAVARDGFPAHPYLVAAMKNSKISRNEDMKRIFYIRDDKAPGGWRPPAVNETCCQRPKLAALLSDVAVSGPSVFYEGKYTTSMVHEIQKAGGIASVEDFKGAQAYAEAPIKVHVFGVDIWCPPPPSSAIAIMAALLLLEGYETPFAASGYTGIHREIEALKHAFALRTALGDPGCAVNDCRNSSFVPHLEEVLEDALSTSFIKSLRNAIRDDQTLNPKEYGGRWNILNGGLVPDDHGTSHMSLVDSSGMAVSLTSTINTGFGSGILSSSTEIIFNNQMDDFSTASQSNVYGLPPASANFIRPGKKPLSSMSPLIAEQGGGLLLVAGGSGGPRIISALLQFLTRLLAEGETVFDAIAKPRLHHQLVPNAIFAENWDYFKYDNETLSFLRKRGHNVTFSDWGAVIQAVVARVDEKFVAVSDPRKDGAPAGQ